MGKKNRKARELGKSEISEESEASGVLKDSEKKSLREESRIYSWVLRGGSWMKRFLAGLGERRKILFLIALLFGMIVRADMFVMSAGGNSFYQHDVVGKDGHLDYIETIYETGRLPKTNAVQYYHPPLHHIISAGFLKFLMVFMDDLFVAETYLKILSLLYSVLLIVVVWKITGEIGLTMRVRRVIMLLFLFHPTLVFMSISINNDPLSVLLIHYSLLLLIRWWKKPSVAGAAKLGLFTGLSVMTKISGMVLFPVELVILLVKFFRRKDKKRIWRDYIKMALVFMLISLPIGLWYPARNYVKFGQELTYVLDQGDVNMMAKSELATAMSRQSVEQNFYIKFGKIGGCYLGNENVFRVPRKEDFVNGILGDEPQRVAGYNFYILTIRSAMMEDYLPLKEWEWVPMICVMSMNYMLVMLYIIYMVRGIWRVFRGRFVGERLGWWMIIISLSGFLMFGYIRTMVKLPYCFTANFRYITPMILMMVTMLGMAEREGVKWRTISEIGFLLMLGSTVISDIIIMI